MLLRKLKNITQDELAKRMKATQQYVSELESQDHFNGEKLNKILRALDSNKEEWELLKKITTPHQKLGSR